MKKITLLLSGLLLLGIGATKAQYTVLHNFTYNSYPWENNFIRAGNVLYGNTENGGASGNGNIFSINADGTNYTEIYHFSDTGSHSMNCSGGGPYGALTLIGNTFYGMTEWGGLYGKGTVFSIHTDGTHYRDLMDFKDTGSISGNWGGANPYGSFVAIGGRLFGMSYAGGKNASGNIFRIDTNGKHYKNLWSFDGGGDTNGSYPEYNNLTVSPNGKLLYGMTYTGGKNSSGNIFRIDTNGKGYKDLYDFGNFSNDGSNPYCSLTMSGSKFFASTSNGGYYGYGTVFSIDTTGKNYKQLLYFNGTGNGGYPYGGVTISGNMLYGTTDNGGTTGYGTLYSLDTTGSQNSTLYNFDQYSSGGYVSGDLLIYNGKAYGMTEEYGGLNGGTVFSMDLCGFNTTDLTTTSTPGDGNGTATVSAAGGASPYNYVWSPGGQTTATATGLKAATYTVTVTSANGCQTSSSVNVGSTLGINNLTANAGISVYPNPNSGNFTVTLSGTSNKSTVEVYNMIGQQVFTHSLILGNNTMEMNTSNGVYMFRIISDNGNLVGQGKLIIQK